MSLAKDSGAQRYSGQPKQERKTTSGRTPSTRSHTSADYISTTHLRLHSLHTYMQLANSRHENLSGRGLGALKRRVAPAGSRWITDPKRTCAQALGSGATFTPPCVSLRPPTQSSSKLKFRAVFLWLLVLFCMYYWQSLNL